MTDLELAATIKILRERIRLARQCDGAVVLSPSLASEIRRELATLLADRKAA